MIRDVMVRLDGSAGDDARLAAATQIAEIFQSHITGLFFNVAPDEFGGANANQAVDLLTQHWRSAGSQKHLAALRACRQAMNGGIAADVARNALVDAVREAHMLVE